MTTLRRGPRACPWGSTKRWTRWMQSRMLSATIALAISPGMGVPAAFALEPLSSQLRPLPAERAGLGLRGISEESFLRTFAFPDGELPQEVFTQEGIVWVDRRLLGSRSTDQVSYADVGLVKGGIEHYLVHVEAYDRLVQSKPWIRQADDKVFQHELKEAVIQLRRELRELPNEERAKVLREAAQKATIKVGVDDPEASSREEVTQRLLEVSENVDVDFTNQVLKEQERGLVRLDPQWVHDVAYGTEPPAVLAQLTGQATPAGKSWVNQTLLPPLGDVTQHVVETSSGSPFAILLEHIRTTEQSFPGPLLQLWRELFWDPGKVTEEIKASRRSEFQRSLADLRDEEQRRFLQRLHEGVEWLHRRTEKDIRVRQTIGSLFVRPDNDQIRFVLVEPGFLGNQMARYFEVTRFGDKPVIAIDEAFYRYTIGGETVTSGGQRVFLERLLHELVHDNRLGTYEEELAEEKRVLREIDWLLYEALGADTDVKAFLAGLPPEAKPAVTGKAKYTYFAQLSQKASQVSGVGEREKFIRDGLEVYAREVVSGDLRRFGKAFALPAAPAPAVVIREDVARQFPELFGTKTVNGRPVNVEQTIAALTKELGPDIANALTARRELLESRTPAKEKYAFPKWDEQFTDVDGKVLTFRQIVQGMIDNFLGRDTELRWRLNDEVPIPDDAHPLKNPGLELTGPWYPDDMAIKQIEADVAATMGPDDEDAAPADYVPFGAEDQPVGLYASRDNERRLLAGELTEYRVVKRGRVRTYTITKPLGQRPASFHRAPGIHLRDQYVTLNGKPVPSIIVDYAIHALNDYGSLTKVGSGLYYYQPKVQTANEALIVTKLLNRLEDVMGLKRGTIKIKVLYEEGRAGLQLPAIMWVLRHRLIGTNVGRWDYTGGLIEMWKDERVLPDPQNGSLMGMTSPHMMAYQRYNALLNVMVGMKGGQLTTAAPIGGMAAVMLYPPTDPYGRHRHNPVTLRAMKNDKMRERSIGLMFVPAEPLPKDVHPILQDILAGRVEGTFIDAYRQSWVATPDATYVAAGNAPLRTPIEQLQALIGVEETWEEFDGQRVAPKVTSGLTQDERKQLASLGLLNEAGQITPWVITPDAIETPEKLFSKAFWREKDLWGSLYDIPAGEITIENVQHAFYMDGNYGFQILNGNLAAAIDDYKLVPGHTVRFMNDLATYRIDVGWPWTVIRLGARITKGGWLKRPVLTDDGVIPGEDAIELKAGTVVTPEVFEQLWQLHNEWTEAFFKDQDRLAAVRLVAATMVDRHEGKDHPEREDLILYVVQAVVTSMMKQLSPDATAARVAKVLGVEPSAIQGDLALLQHVAPMTPILSRAYGQGPAYQKELSYQEAAAQIAAVLGVEPSAALAEIEAAAPRFDRSKALVIMDVLKRQLLSSRYVQHSPRVLFVIAEKNAQERTHILNAVYSVDEHGTLLFRDTNGQPSRAKLVEAVASGTLPQYALDAHDYVYDIVPELTPIPPAPSPVKERWTQADLERVRSPLDGVDRITLANLKAKKFWDIVTSKDPEVYALGLGILLGEQAVQVATVHHGLKKTGKKFEVFDYDGGWNQAAKHKRPDISLFDWQKMIDLIEDKDNALRMEARVVKLEGGDLTLDDWVIPGVVDLEARGGPVQAYDQTTRVLEAGEGVVHREDQDSEIKKCGHFGDKHLISLDDFIQKLEADQLAGKVKGVDIVEIVRTDGLDGKWINKATNPLDRDFIEGRVNGEVMTYAEARQRGLAGPWTNQGVTGQWDPIIEGGHYKIRHGVDFVIARFLAIAAWAAEHNFKILFWFEDQDADLDRARRIIEAVHAKFSDIPFAYNMSGNFNWVEILKQRGHAYLETFVKELVRMGYKYPFITTAGYHALTYSMFELTMHVAEHGIIAYEKFQEKEWELEPKGYQGVRGQRQAGAPYYDAIAKLLGASQAMPGSTEVAQFLSAWDGLTLHDRGLLKHEIDDALRVGAGEANRANVADVLARLYEQQKKQRPKRVDPSIGEKTVKTLEGFGVNSLEAPYIVDTVVGKALTEHWVSVVYSSDLPPKIRDEKLSPIIEEALQILYPEIVTPPEAKPGITGTEAEWLTTRAKLQGILARVYLHPFDLTGRFIESLRGVGLSWEKAYEDFNRASIAGSTEVKFVILGSHKTDGVWEQFKQLFPDLDPQDFTLKVQRQGRGPYEDTSPETVFETDDIARLVPRSTPGSPAGVFEVLLRAEVPGGDSGLTRLGIAQRLNRAVSTIEPDLSALKAWNLIDVVGSGEAATFQATADAKAAGKSILEVLGRLPRARPSRAERDAVAPKIAAILEGGGAPVNKEQNQLVINWLNTKFLPPDKPLTPEQESKVSVYLNQIPPDEGFVELNEETARFLLNVVASAVPPAPRDSGSTQAQLPLFSDQVKRPGRGGEGTEAENRAALVKRVLAEVLLPGRDVIYAQVTSTMLHLFSGGMIETLSSGNLHEALQYPYIRQQVAERLQVPDEQREPFISQLAQSETVEEIIQLHEALYTPAAGAPVASEDTIGTPVTWQDVVLTDTDKFVQHFRNVVGQLRAKGALVTFRESPDSRPEIHLTKPSDGSLESELQWMINHPPALVTAATVHPRTGPSYVAFGVYDSQLFEILKAAAAPTWQEVREAITRINRLDSFVQVVLEDEPTLEGDRILISHKVGEHGSGGTWFAGRWNYTSVAQTVRLEIQRGPQASPDLLRRALLDVSVKVSTKAQKAIQLLVQALEGQPATTAGSAPVSLDDRRKVLTGTLSVLTQDQQFNAYVMIDTIQANEALKSLAQETAAWLDQPAPQVGDRQALAKQRQRARKFEQRWIQLSAPMEGITRDAIRDYPPSQKQIEDFLRKLQDVLREVIDYTEALEDALLEQGGGRAPVTVADRTKEAIARVLGLKPEDITGALRELPGYDSLTAVLIEESLADEFGVPRERHADFVDHLAEIQTVEEIIPYLQTVELQAPHGVAPVAEPTWDQVHDKVIELFGQEGEFAHFGDAVEQSVRTLVWGYVPPEGEEATPKAAILAALANPQTPSGADTAAVRTVLRKLADIYGGAPTKVGGGGMGTEADDFAFRVRGAIADTLNDLFELAQDQAFKPGDVMGRTLKDLFKDAFSKAPDETSRGIVESLSESEWGPWATDTMALALAVDFDIPQEQQGEFSKGLNGEMTDTQIIAYVQQFIGQEAAKRSVSAPVEEELHAAEIAVAQAQAALGIAEAAWAQAAGRAEFNPENPDLRGQKISAQAAVAAAQRVLQQAQARLVQLQSRRSKPARGVGGSTVMGREEFTQAWTRAQAGEGDAKRWLEIQRAEHPDRFWAWVSDEELEPVALLLEVQVPVERREPLVQRILDGFVAKQRDQAKDKITRLLGDDLLGLQALTVQRLTQLGLPMEDALSRVSALVERVGIVDRVKSTIASSLGISPEEVRGDLEITPHLPAIENALAGGLLLRHIPLTDLPSFSDGLRKQRTVDQVIAYVPWFYDQMRFYDRLIDALMEQASSVAEAERGDVGVQVIDRVNEVFQKGRVEDHDVEAIARLLRSDQAVVRRLLLEAVAHIAKNRAAYEALHAPRVEKVGPLSLSSEAVPPKPTPSGGAGTVADDVAQRAKQRMADGLTKELELSTPLLAGEVIGSLQALILRQRDVQPEDWPLISRALAQGLAEEFGLSEKFRAQIEQKLDLSNEQIQTTAEQVVDYLRELLGVAEVQGVIAEALTRWFQRANLDPGRNVIAEVLGVKPEEVTGDLNLKKLILGVTDSESAPMGPEQWVAWDYQNIARALAIALRIPTDQFGTFYGLLAPSVSSATVQEVLDRAWSFANPVLPEQMTGSIGDVVERVAGRQLSFEELREALRALAWSLAEHFESTSQDPGGFSIELNLMLGDPATTVEQIAAHVQQTRASLPTDREEEANLLAELASSDNEVAKRAWFGPSLRDRWSALSESVRQRALVAAFNNPHLTIDVWGFLEVKWPSLSETLRQTLTAERLESALTSSHPHLYRAAWEFLEARWSDLPDFLRQIVTPELIATALTKNAPRIGHPYSLAPWKFVQRRSADLPEELTESSMVAALDSPYDIIAEEAWKYISGGYSVRWSELPAPVKAAVTTERLTRELDSGNPHAWGLLLSSWHLLPEGLKSSLTPDLLRKKIASGAAQGFFTYWRRQLPPSLQEVAKLVSVEGSLEGESFTVNVGANTVAEALNGAVRQQLRADRLYRFLFDENGQIRPSVRVEKNGQLVADFSDPVQENDEITVFHTGEQETPSGSSTPPISSSGSEPGGGLGLSGQKALEGTAAGDLGIRVGSLDLQKPAPRIAYVGLPDRAEPLNGSTSMTVAVMPAPESARDGSLTPYTSGATAFSIALQGVAAGDGWLPPPVVGRPDVEQSGRGMARVNPDTVEARVGNYVKAYQEFAKFD